MNLRALPLPLGLELLTPRLMLRAPREDENIGPEVNAIIQASWSELNAWLPWAKTIPTEEDCAMKARHALWKWENRTEFDFALRLRSNGQMVGKCGLHTIDSNVERAEIGYWLHTSFAGQGLMSEAINCLIQWADELGFQRLEIRCETRNIRSRNVAHHAGFQHEGTLRRFCFDNRNKLCDLEIWSRLRD